MQDSKQASLQGREERKPWYLDVGLEFGEEGTSVSPMLMTYMVVCYSISFANLGHLVRLSLNAPVLPQSALGNLEIVPGSAVKSKREAMSLALAWWSQERLQIFANSAHRPP